MSGWVKIHRSIKDNWLWQEKPYTKAQAWIDLIISASYKDSTFIKNGRIVKVKRGQVAKSEINIAQQWGWSRNKVRRFLNVLEAECMVEQLKDSTLTIISICNFEKYNNLETENGTADGTTDDTADELQYKKVKKVKNNNTTNVVLEPAKAVQYGKSEINELFDYWQQNTGLQITTQITKNRQACSTLYKKHGIDGVRKLIILVAKAHTDKYSPRVSNFIQLRDKENELLIWAKQQFSQRGVVKI